jgi:hypothetical protein
VKPITWRAPQFQSGRRMLIADHGGQDHRLHLVEEQRSLGAVGSGADDLIAKHGK